MGKEHFKQITEETFHFLNNKGVSFICYIWDSKCDFGGGCQSANADLGDALVVIERLVERFHINPEALYQSLMETKARMGNNYN